jgi:FkbM family methyltransferase
MQPVTRIGYARFAGRRITVQKNCYNGVHLSWLSYTVAEPYRDNRWRGLIGQCRNQTVVRIWQRASLQAFNTQLGSFRLNLSKLKYEFIRTPFERPLMLLRRSAGHFTRKGSPELRDLLLEDSRVDLFLRRIIQRNTNCIDVGCHYGSMLSRFCSLAPEGHHLAVEAVPFKVSFLRRKFPEVELLNMALSDHSGTTSFYVNLGETGFSGLARHGNGNFEQITVPCDSLDNIVPQDRKFELLKIDVEGAELFVVRGATQFLVRDRPTIMFECGPSGPVAFGYTAGDLFDAFITNNYAVFFLKDIVAGGQPADRASFENALVYPFKAFNWIAVAKEKIPEVLSRAGRP